MRHYAARQRQSGQWDYTVERDRRIHPVGYCAGAFAALWPEDPTDLDLRVFGGREAYANGRARYLAFAEKFHGHGHATAAEARACYREFVLDTEIAYLAGDDQAADALFRCQAVGGCIERTSGGAVWSGTSCQFHLCATHRTREAVAALLGDIGESWRS